MIVLSLSQTFVASMSVWIGRVSKNGPLSGLSTQMTKRTYAIQALHSNVYFRQRWINFVCYCAIYSSILLFLRPRARPRVGVDSPTQIHHDNLCRHDSAHLWTPWAPSWAPMLCQYCTSSSAVSDLYNVWHVPMVRSDLSALEIERSRFEFWPNSVSYDTQPWNRAHFQACRDQAMSLKGHALHDRTCLLIPSHCQLRIACQSNTR